MKRSCLDSSKKKDNRTLVIRQRVCIKKKLKRKENNFCASLHNSKIFLVEKGNTQLPCDACPKAEEK